MHVQDLTALGMWTSRERTPYQCALDEGTFAGFECFPALDHGRDINLDNQLCHSGSISEEARGMVSLDVCRLNLVIIIWSKLHMITIIARYIPGKKNVLVDQLSSLDQMLPSHRMVSSSSGVQICYPFQILRCERRMHFNTGGTT